MSKDSDSVVRKMFIIASLVVVAEGWQGSFKGFLARLFSISSYEIASPRSVSIFISSGVERAAAAGRSDEERGGMYNFVAGTRGWPWFIRHVLEFQL